MKFNPNGLSYERWLAAAAVPSSKAAKRAWLYGEDPSDHRALKDTVTAADILSGGKRRAKKMR